jgi:hypothetical protein
MEEGLLHYETSDKWKNKMEKGSSKHEHVLAEFIAKYNEASPGLRTVCGMTPTWDSRLYETWSEVEKEDFIERAKMFLRRFEQHRLANARQKEEENAKEQAVQKRFDELIASGTTAKSLLARFMKRTPEERAYIFSYVFGNDYHQPETTALMFYARWAMAEKTRDIAKEDYVEYVEDLLEALETFE